MLEERGVNVALSVGLEMRRNGKPFTLVLEVMFDRLSNGFRRGFRVRYSEPNCRWPDSIWRAERSEKQTNDDSYLEKRRNTLTFVAR